MERYQPLIQFQLLQWACPLISSDTSLYWTTYSATRHRHHTLPSMPLSHSQDSKCRPFWSHILPNILLCELDFGSTQIIICVMIRLALPQPPCAIDSSFSIRGCLLTVPGPHTTRPAPCHSSRQQTVPPCCSFSQHAANSCTQHRFFQKQEQFCLPHCF